MFEASLARILKFSEKTFRCLFLPKAITLEPICGSDASGKRFFTRVAFVGVDLLILPERMNTMGDPRFRTEDKNCVKILLTLSHNKLQFFLGSKVTSAAEGGGFYWLIHDSR